MKHRSLHITWTLFYRETEVGKWKQWSTYETRSRARDSQKTIRAIHGQRNTKIQRNDDTPKKKAKSKAHLNGH